MDRADILQQLKAIILSELSNEDANVYLFGSWARRQERLSSDIDVAVEFVSVGEQQRETMMRLREAVYESHIPYHVDLVELGSADAVIVEKVKEEGILWSVEQNELQSHERL